MANYDAMLVFGVGPVERRRSGTPKLPIFGRMNALAAGMLLKEHAVGKLIPSGAKTGGMDLPSEASLMAQLLRTRFDVSPDLLVLETQALNTIQNIVYAYNMLWSPKATSISFLMVASGYHIPRIRQICELLRIQADYCVAEDVLVNRSNGHKDILEHTLDPATNPIYGDILAMEVRWRRGLREIPEYWLCELALFHDLDHVRNLLSELPECRDYVLENIPIPLDQISDADLVSWLHGIPVKRPPISWAEEPI